MLVARLGPVQLVTLHKSERHRSTNLRRNRLVKDFQLHKINNQVIQCILFKV